VFFPQLSFLSKAGNETHDPFTKGGATFKPCECGAGQACQVSSLLEDSGAASPKQAILALHT